MREHFWREWILHGHGLRLAGAGMGEMTLSLFIQRSRLCRFAELVGYGGWHLGDLKVRGLPRPGLSGMARGGGAIGVPRFPDWHREVDTPGWVLRALEGRYCQHMYSKRPKGKGH
jgi:hypothetical protein